ncbi:TIR domain-containing protein [Roseibium alexandrii]|uniref:Thoeris protein ThsB TIR-like domain-containing protein n=1 Tax=Roseibium alexandrii TaxID=388408 RepID=A0A0M7AE64_9HYPH|nr:TIR domain-containing protein [Roseibium alexandrii]CTQ72907.1 hypothetical protein LAX5112_03360 [Roseibium alexandrii]
MAYRNKVFVSFDGDSDMSYYRLMLAWRKSDHSSFNFYNAHDLTSSRDSSLELTIKSSLQQRMINSKLFILLVGANTRYLYKFVRWEIEQAIKRDLPIVCVNLNGLRHIDNERCPAILRDELALHVSFNSRIIERAINEWPSSKKNLEIQGRKGPFFYPEDVYSLLGIVR